MMKETDAVTGIRRMGRDGFVDYVIDVAKCHGLHIAEYPCGKDADILIFRHWSKMHEKIDEIMIDNPGIDVIYGQDLCHQVPAIVRHHDEIHSKNKGRIHG